jgi:tRNA A-37 threonylcarbamoyl transferase component Bud32
MVRRRDRAAPTTEIRAAPLGEATATATAIHALAKASERMKGSEEEATAGSRLTPEPAWACPAAEDRAVQSFTLERQRALERCEHSASVRRLCWAVSIGLVVWPATGLLDWWVTSMAGAGDLRTFLTLRVLGLMPGLAAWWRLRRTDEPSRLALYAIDVGLFTWVSILVSAMCISLGGISSAYAGGLIAILVARGATTVAPWRRGMLLFGVPAASFPLTVLIASRFDVELQEQLNNPVQLAGFVSHVIFLVTTGLLLTVGGDFAWRLRREALEHRNIGRYKLERRIGGGGMGEVWAAFDLTLKQRVALKTVRGHQLGSSAVSRLEREVLALAELTHPNTVRVFDHGVTEDGLWYYAMELLHGHNLRQLVDREGPLPTARLISIACKLLRALGEAHEKGIVHRDVKPDNVFIAEFGSERDVPKLLDFGIAQSLARNEPLLTSTGWLVGTPAYMAPEVIRGRPADVRSDIYSFGCTLFFALSGTLPFADTDREALFDAHLHRAAPLLSSVASQNIPPSLERIIGRCMAKLPSERYSAAHALLEELQQVAMALE